jgi:glycosyltransferase involved in cell wall biosynthesis
MTISIICPVYEMAGKGVEFLSELLESILMQTYKDYEVIITDNSKNNDIQDYIQSTWETQDFRYIRNNTDSGARNFNYGMNFAKGEVIKPMFQDDKFLDSGTLKHIAEAFKNPINWLVCGSNNQGTNNWIHTPWQYSGYKELLEGENTYGSPSAIAFWNCDLRFDESLIWLMDCEFYTRLIKKFGIPTLLKDEIFIRQWPGQVTETTAVGNIRIVEQGYCLSKHGI